MGFWGEQALVPVRGDTGVHASVFAITFIFLCQGSWGPGHLAGGLWGGSLQYTMSSGCLCFWQLEVGEAHEENTKV